MSSLHPFATVLRQQKERRIERLARSTAITSFNPDVVVACAQWEWDRQGPLRRHVA